MQMGSAPLLFLPAPIINASFRSVLALPHFPLADTRLTPHYPARSPLEAVLRFATPGSDDFITEGEAFQIAKLLTDWSRTLEANSAATPVLSGFLDPEIQSTGFATLRESPLRPGDRIEVVRRTFQSEMFRGRERFLREMKNYLATFRHIETAEFDIYECDPVSDSPLTLEAKIRYDIAGILSDQARSERIGSWTTRWSQNESGAWRVVKWIATAETISRAIGPMFIDITSHALGTIDSYREQLLHGADYWRTVLDGAIGVDVYGNNGLAVGDFDNDGREDLYICQPAGLPNRLYRNRGDGTFEDVTEMCGVGVLDFTASALFADFQNRGVQDLLVVCATGPLLFVNEGNGRFSLKRDAFHFARPPQGAFTHVAAADYDRDGRLDLYFCLYNYYQGLDQYRYPVPYFDARNGPPNYLFHNEGNGFFEDRTEAAGLNVENDRYSFACCWGDANGDGWPDLYVVNDFGRNNLYRNQGDGTFGAVSGQAKVDEAGAGMSACWLDFDNDGQQDIYAAGMWVADGLRVFGDSHFHGSEPPRIRELYRRHMSGNSLYQNQGNGTFENEAPPSGVEMGRWSWSTDAWDFDHDGFPDLYVANGYISGIESRDVSSFFWRQVVAKSPPDSSPAPDYEQGWSAMNELIRSDATWNGHERNVFFANNRDGTFSDVSGVVGMDFPDDSRAFALADFDGDGRLEVVLKNRNAPQVRLLRLAMEGIGNAIALRLRGRTSNRDAIGASVTVSSRNLRQTKYVQAGSGFLSQHSKELFFGIGSHRDPVNISVRWPNGLVQTFEKLPVNHRIDIEEGVPTFQARAFLTSPQPWSQPGDASGPENLPASVETWLIDPVKAPDFSLTDTGGNLRDLRSLRGSFVLLTFWKSDSDACRDVLQALRQAQPQFTSRLQVLAVNIDDSSDARALQSFVGNNNFPFPILLASQEMSGVYNIVYRYLFDRHRDLPLPTSFLIDEAGAVVKVYQGAMAGEKLLKDLAGVPRTAGDRLRKALPFAGTLCQDTFQRNSFTYGVAFFQHGFLNESAESFKRVIAEKPDDAEALYNLGTLYLRRNSLEESRKYLEQAVKLRPNYPDAWNNLGMIAAQQASYDEASKDFQQAVQLRPRYATALLNLGNVYRQQGNLDQAEKFLMRALEAEPSNPEINFNLGMLYAHRDQTERAIEYLQKAVRVRPDYSEALNNLGVLLVQKNQYVDAQQQFEACVQAAPDFDQGYLNLARVDILLNQKEKARTVLQDLLKKQPQHQMAQKMLQMLY